MAALADPRSVSGYQIELFETPGDRVIADDPIGRNPGLQTNGDAMRRDGRSETSEFLPGIEGSECLSPRPALLIFMNGFK
jgi:hypothetical protein